MAGLNERVNRRLDSGCQDAEGVILDEGVESWNVRFRVDCSQIHVERVEGC